MSFRIENLSAVVFLGASLDAPEFIQIAKRKGLVSEIVTNPAQLGDLPKGLASLVTEKVDQEFVTHIRQISDPATTLYVSLGARWIFKNRIIVDLMQDHLVNFHGARLPYDAGGGGFSWRIMNSDRIDTQLVHMIDEGVDTGPVLDSNSVILPRECVTPRDIHAFYRKRVLGFYEGFVGALLEGRSFAKRIQPSYLGRYFPRLMTAKNGWINWGWSSSDLISFITAFDDPYAGASTMLNGKPVRLKGVHRHGGEMGAHPFMSGLVTRHDGGWIVVSTGDSHSLLVEKVEDENGIDLLAKIRAGDRFYTTQDLLDAALSERVRYGVS